MRSSFSHAAVVCVTLLCGGLVPTLRADRAASEEMRQAEAELNHVYQKALSAMPDGEAKAQLRESQRAWITFRDEEMSLLQHSGVGAGNTEKESHMTGLYQDRAKQLQDLIDMTK